jgi:hypothetical protein
MYIDPTNVRANEKGHWWLKVYSDDAQNIRNVMGLGVPYFGFHLTIGLATHDELEKSEIVRVTKTDGYVDGNRLLIERLIRKGVLKYKDGSLVNYTVVFMVLKSLLFLYQGVNFNILKEIFT